MLNAVNNIIARHGIDPQARQIGVDRDIARAAAGVAHAIGDRGINRQVAVTQRLNIRRRNADTPA